MPRSSTGARLTPPRRSSPEPPASSCASPCARWMPCSQWRAQRSEERRVGKECRSLCDWSSDVCSSDLWCSLDASAQKLSRAACQQLRFSVRTMDAMLTVARTVADLAGSEQIQANHLAEAIQYQPRPDQF